MGTLCDIGAWALGYSYSKGEQEYHDCSDRGCTGKQASVGVAGHKGLWGKHSNSDTELGLDIHCFFLKSRKPGLATFFVYGWLLEQWICFGIDAPYRNENMTLIKRHFVRFKHCQYLTPGRWKGGQGRPAFWVLGSSLCGPCVAGGEWADGPSGLQKSFIFAKLSCVYVYSQNNIILL